MRFQLNFGTSRPLPPLLVGGGKSAPPSKFRTKNAGLNRVNLMIHISKIHFACQNILLAKTGSKCTVRLPNILYNQMFTSFSCARQNVAEKWKLLRENIYGSAALRCIALSLIKMIGKVLSKFHLNCDIFFSVHKQ